MKEMSDIQYYSITGILPILIGWGSQLALSDEPKNNRPEAGVNPLDNRPQYLPTRPYSKAPVRRRMMSGRR
jgi:hypothetical protein